MGSGRGLSADPVRLTESVVKQILRVSVGYGGGYMGIQAKPFAPERFQLVRWPVTDSIRDIRGCPDTEENNKSEGELLSEFLNVSI